MTVHDRLRGAGFVPGIPRASVLRLATYSALLGAVIFGIYAGTLSHAFVFDDMPFIQQNAIIRDLANVPEMFRSGFWESTSAAQRTHYRPLTTVSYAVDHALGGLDPAQYHLTNLVLHWVNAVILMLLVSTITGTTGLALAVAAVFAVHPIASEAVAWAAGRSELLAATFTLGALTMYVRPERENRSGFSAAGDVAGAALFVMALLSKEGAVALLGVLLLLELGRSGGPRWRRWAPYAAVTTAYLLGLRFAFGDLRALPIDPVYNPLVSEPLSARVLTGFTLLARAIGLWAWPGSLSADYSYNAIPVVQGLGELPVLVGLLVLAALIAALAATRRRLVAVYLGVSVTAAFLALLGVNVASPTASLFAERFLYLPTVGLALACVVALHTRLEARGSGWQVGGRVALALVLVALSVRTWIRVPDWKDQMTVFRSAVAAQPQSAFARASLSSAYFQTGQYALAAAQADTASQIFPDYAFAWLTRGDAAIAQGDLATAVRYLQTAIDLEPSGAANHVSMGVAQVRLGNLDAADRHYRAALALNPRLPVVLNNLGSLVQRRGNRSEAIDLWERALAIDPAHPEALLNLGNAYDRDGRREEAAVLYRRFLETAPPRYQAQKDLLRARLSRM